MSYEQCCVDRFAVPSADESPVRLPSVLELATPITDIIVMPQEEELVTPMTDLDVVLQTPVTPMANIVVAL